jgi:autotransporter-associated beta strand protein
MTLYEPNIETGRMVFPAHRKAGRWFFSWLTVVTCIWFLVSSAYPSFGQSSSQQLYLQCLTNFEAYAQTIWHTNSVGIPDAGYWGDGGSTGNGAIRGNSGIAVAYAVLCVALPNDPKYATRLTYLRQALNYDYNTHVTGGYNTTSGNKWGWSNGSLATCTSQGGSDWQTPLWSGSMGLACLLMQSNLPAATVTGVQTAVISEANHRAAIPPCTRILSDGDTKAEENAWDGNILALAAAWMTNNASASNWLYAAKSYLANTYTVAYPDLITPNTVGDPLASWISTVTIFPSYALENHGFYHPTYEMVAGMSAGDSLLMARLANTNIAAQLQPFAEHNVMAVWTNNLDTLVTGTGDFAYPSGVDWSVRDFEHNSFMAWIAAHFNDPIARWADNQLSQCVRYRQLVNGDGTFVGISANPGGGILFYREAVEARRTAIAWLHWNGADFPTGPMTAPASTIMNNTDVQVIHQRSPFGTFSVSYNGARVMANVDAVALSVPTNAFISSPRLPGILGFGALGNPTSASLISYATNTSGGFDAELKITSSLGNTEAYIKSTSASVALIEVPTLNSGATASSGGSFICGIENDPLTGGSRLLEWASNSATIPALSGTAVNVSNNWICVSGRYGLTAGPAGYFRYVANTSYTRTDSAGYSESGEAEDALSFVENNQLAPRYAVWFPAQNALQTSNAAAAIVWATNSTTATLTFPGAGGAATTLSAAIGSGNGAWNTDADGFWSDAGNWNNGAIAAGAGYTADFSTINISANRTVTLDTARSLGALKFGDTGGAQNWTITNSPGSTLTLNNGSSSPTIAVANTATLAGPLAGTSGFIKSGPGTLILSGGNSLAGTLYVDNALTGSTSEGAVRIANNAAVANVSSPIYIRDNNSASSTLQLDGTSGNLNLTQGISLAGRNAAVMAIQNLAGSNTIAGDFTLASGGGNYWFDSDAGKLNLAGQLPASAPSVPNGRTLTFMGAGDFQISGPINNANGYAVTLVKSNSGTLTLNGINTYTGTTTVAGGTLAGNGTIAGPVTVASGASLAPGGGGIGTLTINNALTNNGTFVIRLNKSGATLTNDNVKGVSTLVFGGPLQLVSTGDQITAGDSFKVFFSTNYRNAISGITPATPGTNLLWNTSNLVVNGTLSVSLGAVSPQVGNVFLTGTNLVLSGGGGAAGYGFSELSATNLTSPVAGWPVIATGVCDSNGNFSLTNGITSSNSQQYYVIRIP